MWKQTRGNTNNLFMLMMLKFQLPKQTLHNFWFMFINQIGGWNSYCGKETNKWWRHQNPKCCETPNIGGRQIFGILKYSEYRAKFQFVKQTVLLLIVCIYIGTSKLVKMMTSLIWRAQEWWNREPRKPDRIVMRILNQNSACTRDTYGISVGNNSFVSVFIIILYYNTDLFFCYL